MNKTTKKTRSEIALQSTIKIFMIVSMVVFLIGLISAGKESLGVFKQNENVRIVQVCDDATYITISSISYPNGSVADSAITMTSAGNGEYYYDFSDTSQLGEYDVRGISDGCEGTFTFSFEVSGGGDSFGIPQALLLLGQFGLIVLFFGIGLTFKQEKWKLKHFFFMFSLLMGIVLLNTIRIMIGTSTDLAKMGMVGLIIGIVVLSFMFLYLLILYTVEVFSYFKDKSNMKWSVGGKE
jgi:hypothetical protein